MGAGGTGGAVVVATSSVCLARPHDRTARRQCRGSDTAHVRRPALLAETLARPDSPAVQNLLRHQRPPRAGQPWLMARRRDCRGPDSGSAVAAAALMTPIVVHMLTRPALREAAGLAMPDVDCVCDIFTEAFVRAVATEPPAPKRADR